MMETLHSCKAVQFSNFCDFLPFATLHIAAPLCILSLRTCRYKIHLLISVTLSCHHPSRQQQERFVSTTRLILLTISTRLKMRFSILHIIYFLKTSETVLTPGLIVLSVIPFAIKRNERQSAYCHWVPALSSSHIACAIQLEEMLDIALVRPPE